MIIPFDKDFKARAEVTKFVDEFSRKPASWRQEFLRRLEASVGDAAGAKECLAALADLHHVITLKDKK